MSGYPAEDCGAAREKIIAQLAHFLSRPEETSLVLLEGERGSGCSDLIDVAMVRLRGTDRASALIRFDLEGFEPDGATVSMFQEYHRRKWSAHGYLPVSFPHVYWTAEERRGGHGAFLSALRALAAELPLICHLTDIGTISDPFLWSLIAEAEANPDFLLVLSCRPWEIPARALPEPSVGIFRVQVPPLSVSEPNAGLLLAEIVRASWPNSLGGLGSQFLVLAGLCGDVVPADLLLQYLGVLEEERDSFLDFLDHSFVERGLLEDLEYRHPSFPKLAVYRFSDTLVARTLLEAMPEPDLALLREGFFSFLKDSLGPQTRGACRLLLEVAPDWARDERERLARGLAWWVVEEEATELENLLAKALGTGRLGPEDLWRVIEETADRWPGFRRRALLGAFEQQPGGVPAYRAGEFHSLRAAAFYDLGLHKNSLNEAFTALRLLPGNRGQDARLGASCQALAGLIALEDGELPAARLCLAAATEAAEAAGAVGSFQTGEDVQVIMGSLRSLEPEALVRSALECVLSISRCPRGFEGRRGADLWKSFADLLRQGGSARSARLSLERALEISRRFAGSHDIQLAIALKNLAELHWELGEHLEVRTRLEEALIIEAEVFGESNEQVSILRNNLIDLLLGAGDLHAAWKHLVQALNAVRSTREEKSPEALILLKHLADLAYRRGDPEAGLEFLTEALAIEESLHGRIDPRVGMILKQLSDCHGQLGNRDQLISFRLRALHIEEAIYGMEDLRILTNLKILERSLRETGDQAAADIFRERVRLIEHCPVHA